MYKSFFIPSFFTFLNFFWGFFSIIKAIEGDLHAAAWFIILAILCDGMDGKLARWMGSDTTFGFELDSLADLISSGLAPAVLVYMAGLTHPQFLWFVVCFLYIFAGSYRLARFNVLQAGDRSEGYIGLPIPVAGMTIASFWLFQYHLEHTVAKGWWAIVLIFLAVLMVSTVPYDWPRFVFRGKWWKVIQSVGLLAAIVMMAIFPQRSLFPFICFYILLGIWNWVSALIRGKIALSEFFL